MAIADFANSCARHLLARVVVQENRRTAREGRGENRDAESFKIRPTALTTAETSTNDDMSIASNGLVPTASLRRHDAGQSHIPTWAFLAIIRLLWGYRRPGLRLEAQTTAGSLGALCAFRQNGTHVSCAIAFEDRAGQVRYEQTTERGCRPTRTSVPCVSGYAAPPSIKPEACDRKNCISGAESMGFSSLY